MKIVVFTGAGISRESGLKTFRDSDGLWENYRIEDVCSTQAWFTQPGVVLEFYNSRRRDVRAAQPNAAHLAIASLEGEGRTVKVITQNIDDLHERAGSSDVLHLHGQIMKMHGSGDDELVDCPGDIHLGDVDRLSRQYRPHVVFFGEPVPNMQIALRIAAEADVMLVVGSTLSVYPAAMIAEETSAKRIWVVDPQFPENLRIKQMWRRGILEFIGKPATEGAPQAVREILEWLVQSSLNR